MKKSSTIAATILFVLAGCGGGNRQAVEELITIDLSKSYPEKELILQDFMDVEYIPLETADSFITQGEVMAVGTEIIVIKNRINDGDLFVFDRKTGKGLRKINRKGQGGEEYVAITEIILDEANNEMFVIAYAGGKISVYDLYGNFKRSFKTADVDNHINTFNYDRKNLISYIPIKSMEDPSNIIHPYYLIFSKQDGSITRKISIPFNEIKEPIARDGEAWAVLVPTSVYQIIPNHGNWIFMNTSSDTVYHYVPDDNMIVPFIVRTPSIHTMDPPEIFLMPTILTDSYYFMNVQKTDFDFATGRGFPSFELMYDKQENTLFRSKVYNGDFTYKKGASMTWHRPLDHKIATWHSLQAHELVEAYENNQLKDGRLKEIAAILDGEDNPVIMLVKHKK